MDEVYDDSPLTARVPLAGDEVERLLRSDGRYFTRDPARVRHLLSRMAATSDAHARVVRQLHADVDRLVAAGKSGTAPLAGALIALGKLSVDEQRQVLDMHAGALVEQLRAATADARRVKLAAVSEANRVRLVLAQVLEDADLPPEVRDRVREYLRRLPATGQVPSDPAPVDVSGMLPAGRGGFTVAPAEPAGESSPSGLGELFS
jgi:hypothetical protein